ncbi:vesicle coat protein [Protomyces lactucae-debilis]|uniref:Vesicle coat protein n=1 Tax=Protomyces lactucae-debilis TaxID=2754530 RepID=A0A1Y2FF38_PROLT|nr:vesicle coat protein [Protomyces lactucae-debilis]ORY82522.1 vesicle coat protein [Protomyces lactucae-debilis]
MNTILSASVWCEVHGPVNIFCTQAMEQAAQPDTQTQTQTQTTTSSATSAATAQQTHPLPPRSSKASCASCSFTLPPDLQSSAAPLLKTQDGNHVYLSQRHPTDPERYKILRSSCIRALSGEMVPGRSGPIFFGDPSIGYNIATIFRLTDHAAGGSTKRTFCFMCTSTEEQDLLRSYTFITDRFAALVEKLVAASQNATQHAVEAQVESSIGLPVGESIASTPALVPQGFLRTKGRAAACGLPELTGMPDVFVQVHAVFAWLLRAWMQHFDGKDAMSSADSVLN